MIKGYDMDKYKIDIENERIIDTETGVIITDKSEIKLIQSDLKQHIQEDKAIEKEVKKMIGEDEEEILHNWKEGTHFNKIYRTELREYMNSIELSPESRAFLFSIQAYIRFITNKIAFKNDKRMSNKDLMNITGLKKKALIYALDELEQKHFIKRTGGTRSREIYCNPYLMCSGDRVLKSTRDLFNKYTPITSY